MASLINPDGTRNIAEFRRLVEIGVAAYPGPRKWWMLKSEWRTREDDYQTLRRMWRRENGLPPERPQVELSASFLADLERYGADCP